MLFLNPGNIIGSSPFIRPSMLHVTIVRYKGLIPKQDLVDFTRSLSGIFEMLVGKTTRVELKNRGDWSFGIDESLSEMCNVLVKSAFVFGKKYQLWSDPWESNGWHVSWH